MPKYKVIVETEIVTHGKKECDDLCSHLANENYSNNRFYSCVLFNKDLDVNDNGNTLRCTKCLEATKNLINFNARRKK